MRLLVRLYTRQFPYHPNWKADATHPAFVSRFAILDHICEEKLLGGVSS
jgi:hypothetical protein